MFSTCKRRDKWVLVDIYQAIFQLWNVLSVNFLTQLTSQMEGSLQDYSTAVLFVCLGFILAQSG